MGGKPIKPKIQAYVEQRWFDEFEVYRTIHNLNQSKALEKLLAEFFGGASAPTLPPDEVLSTSVLVDALRAELTELRYELDHRLQLVESRVAIESAIESTTSTDATASTYESATESAITQNESAVCLDGLATESAMAQTESATIPDRLASGATIVEDASAVYPEDMALGDIGEVENASVGNMVEDIPALVAPSSEPVEESKLVPPAPKSQRNKSGKKELGEVLARVEENLIRGNQLSAKALAPLIGVSYQAIQDRRNAEKQGKTGKLAEWGLRYVLDSRDPQLYERI